MPFDNSVLLSYPLLALRMPFDNSVLFSQHLLAHTLSGCALLQLLQKN